MRFFRPETARERLERHRDRLLQMREQFRARVNAAESKITDDVRPAGELHLSSHPADLASEGFDEDIEVARCETDLLESVEEALARIDERTYGKCTDCGKRVDRKRLEAMPYAALCRKCAEETAESMSP